MFGDLTFKIIYKVGDFGDANNWPTPGEIATKEVQVIKKVFLEIHFDCFCKQ